MSDPFPLKLKYPTEYRSDDGTAAHLISTEVSSKGYANEDHGGELTGYMTVNQEFIKRTKMEDGSANKYKNVFYNDIDDIIVFIWIIRVSIFCVVWD